MLLAALAAAVCLPAYAAPSLRTVDGLAAVPAGAGLAAVALDGRPLPGVSVSAAVEDPRSGRPAGQGFQVRGTWRASGPALRLDGEVRAPGTEERAADLVIRVRGAALPLATMEKDPLLLPGKLLGKLPLVSLRAAGKDLLALAVPVDRLAIFSFRQVKGGVELRYPFGFTTEAKPGLRMRAPFSCVLYRTDPRWHFRSALARYYALFPELFRPFARAQGGWFFAAEIPELPNPQHFAYYEGGPGGWEEARARGLGTYPYRESSSYTISLPGSTPPKSYAEAMAQLESLERQVSPAAWRPQEACDLDTEVRRSGARSLLADSGTTGKWTGSSQSVFLKKPFSGPIQVEGFSRAEGVGGERGNDYSVYVDVVYADGSYLFGQCAAFPPGTHDWARSELTIRPEKPVAELRVYCLLRGRPGKAWFDDLRIGPAGQPEANWLMNPGFEETERRRDLQYIRDNVCWNPRGEWSFYITDNLSADVGPSQPMNLLRFTLNLDPDVPSTPERPATAAAELAYYDQVFKDTPKVDGLYIDSVSAWCYGVLNGRREHWRANDYPFTYEPGTHKVAPHGRFAMFEYLRALQRRYHPRGKPVFTNIHVNLEAFPLYLASDVPGIESSLFQDEDSLFFYRASSYRKPLLLLNFMNLHGLDQRATAEAYHHNAAFWGEFPSTGRFVQRAYREYGDVTHAYVPAIQEISAAGWHPVPLASGARAERFGGKGAVTFTVRAPQDAAQETLLIEPKAVAGLGPALVAFDAVRLQELPLRKRAGRWALPLIHGAGEVQVVRIMPRGGVASWLRARARRHALNATRVRGTAGVTPELRVLLQSLSPHSRPTTQPPTARPTRGPNHPASNLRPMKSGGKPPHSRGRVHSPFTTHHSLPRWHANLQAALASIRGPEDDLFALSRRREVLQARQALASLAAYVSGVRLEIAGPRIGTPGRVLELAALAKAPAGVKVRLLHLGAQPAPATPLALAPLAEADASGTLRLEAGAPQAYDVTAWYEVALPGQPAWAVPVSTRAFFIPAATLRLTEATGTTEERIFTVDVERRAPGMALALRAAAEPAAEVTPSEEALAAGQSRARVRVRRAGDGLPRTLSVLAMGLQGAELARTQASYWDEPPVPAGNLAKGARCTADSSYEGYAPGVLIDGVTAAAGIHWTQQAWASTESADSHWVQIDLPKPVEVGEVWLYWAIDGGRLHASRRYAVVGLADGGRREQARVEGQPPRSFSRHTFTPTRVKAIRIEQAANGGGEARPGLLWLREICLLP